MERVEDVISEYQDNLENQVNQIEDTPKEGTSTDAEAQTEGTQNILISFHELREINGVLHIETQSGLTDQEKIKFLEETEYPSFKGKSREGREKGEMARSKLFDVADTAKLKADYLRLGRGRAVVSERVLEMIKEEANNDLTRLENFKRWFRIRTYWP